MVIPHGWKCILVWFVLLCISSMACIYFDNSERCAYPFFYLWYCWFKEPLLLFRITRFIFIHFCIIMADSCLVCDRKHAIVRHPVSTMQALLWALTIIPTSRERELEVLLESGPCILVKDTSLLLLSDLKWKMVTWGIVRIMWNNTFNVRAPYYMLLHS